MAKSERRKRKQHDPIPESFSSLEEAAEFWDTHSIADYWGQTHEVKDVQINLVRRRLRADADLRAGG